MGLASLDQFDFDHDMPRFTRRLTATLAGSHPSEGRGSAPDNGDIRREMGRARLICHIIVITAHPLYVEDGVICDEKSRYEHHRKEVLYRGVVDLPFGQNGESHQQYRRIFPNVPRGVVYAVLSI